MLIPETRHRIMDDTQPHQIVPPTNSPSAPPPDEKADARPAGTDCPPQPPLRDPRAAAGPS